MEATPASTRTNGKIASPVGDPYVARVGKYGEDVEGGGGKRVNDDAILHRI